VGRLRYNDALGTLGAPLTSGGTTITFTAAPPFATIVAPDYIPLVLDPPTTTPSASFEVVYLTAYTAGATTGTIARGQENTTGVSHTSGASWFCGPTALDYPGARVSSPTSFAGLTTAVEAGARTINTPGRGCQVYSVTVDQPCRVRAYATTAQAAADLSRSQSTDPTGNHGCLLEVVFTASGSLVLAPAVGMVEQDTTPTAAFPCNVRCDAGTTLNVTLNGYIEEV
jgi:hypothetical protein